MVVSLRLSGVQVTDLSLVPGARLGGDTAATTAAAVTNGVAGAAAGAAAAASVGQVRGKAPTNDGTSSGVQH